jgi:hypothetical protein
MCGDVLLFILFISLIFIFLFYQPTAFEILGGAACLGSIVPRKPRPLSRLYLDNGKSIVVDGHNLIHELTEGKPLDPLEFEKALKDISSILLNAYPDQEINIVVKNNPRSTTKKIDKPKTLAYFQNISTHFPTIKYHLAYDEHARKQKKPTHIQKSRDDFLVLLLAGDYVITKDYYRDYKQFAQIPSFWHCHIQNGELKFEIFIKSSVRYTAIKQPTDYHHFIYEILSPEEMEERKLVSGGVYYGEGDKYAKAYFSSLV